MRLLETVEVKQNLKLTLYDRGKIVARREGHNIWVDLGREYLAELIAYSSYDPDVKVRDDRIKYMGLGIGGTRQLALPTANATPMTPAYAGTNEQTDSDATVTTLERPVRVSGSGSAYPYPNDDIWLGTIGTVAFDAATEVTFSRIFLRTEVSYGSFLTVPVSEVGLFTSAASPIYYKNTLVAYDTFDTLAKTSAFALRVDWTIKF
jgi:hypothetical protein